MTEKSWSAGNAAMGADITAPSSPGNPSVASAEMQSMTPSLVSSIETVARARLVTVGVDTLLTEVAALLASSQISLVVVRDATGVAAGVITETILVRQLGFGRADIFTTRAGDVMVHEFTVCRPTDSLPEVLSIMHQRGIIHVPVVDDGKRPLGVVNARDGLRTLLAEGHYEESLLRNYVMGIGYQ